MSEIRLTKRVQAIKPSPTLAISTRARELRAEGRDVISLSAGEPDFDTPGFVKEAAIEAIRAGHTKYTAVDGIPELKEAVVEKLRRDNGLEYGTDQILVSVGAKHSLFNLFEAILQEGDEAIIPAPYWVSYPDMVVLTDASPVVVGAGIEQGFKLTPGQLEEAITPRTRLVILNSPCNPTGVAYSREELAALGEVLLRHPQVVVVTDDIYEHILWTDEPFHNIAMACPDLVPRTVVVNGVSKAYAMTGWRIGYAAGPKPLIAAMRKLQSQSTSNPVSISQYAALAALSGDQSVVEPMVAAFRERHDRVIARLNRVRGMRAIECQGTFYAFPDVRELLGEAGVDDDVALAEQILDRAEVALVPGSAFGAPGYLRLSYATSMENLDKALDRLEKLYGTA